MSDREENKKDEEGRGSGPHKDNIYFKLHGSKRNRSKTSQHSQPLEINEEKDQDDNDHHEEKETRPPRPQIDNSLSNKIDELFEKSAGLKVVIGKYRDRFKTLVKRLAEAKGVDEETKKNLLADEEKLGHNALELNAETEEQLIDSVVDKVVHSVTKILEVSEDNNKKVAQFENQVKTLEAKLKETELKQDSHPYGKEILDLFEKMYKDIQKDLDLITKEIVKGTPENRYDVGDFYLANQRSDPSPSEVCGDNLQRLRRSSK